MRNMVKIGIILIFVVVIALVSYVVYLDSITPSPYDDFAKCLTEKGVVMGGTDWCHYCKQQKTLFGKSFAHINYKNCDVEKEWCQANNVDRYPTWVLSTGEHYLGVQSIERLSQLSGCEI